MGFESTLDAHNDQRAGASAFPEHHVHPLAHLPAFARSSGYPGPRSKPAFVAPNDADLFRLLSNQFLNLSKGISDKFFVALAYAGFFNRKAAQYLFRYLPARISHWQWAVHHHQLHGFSIRRFLPGLVSAKALHARVAVTT